MKRTVVSLIGTIATGAALAAGPAFAQTAAAPTVDSLAKARATFESTCSTCHPLARPEGKVLDADGWNKILDRMKDNGAEFDKDGRAAIVSWLATKSTFDTKCSACHGTDRPLGKNKDLAGWTSTVQRMAGKKPGHLTETEVAAVAAYLSIVRPPTP